MSIKLKDFPTFRKWCDQAPKVMGRIDLLSLDNKQKDAAVAAYCLDKKTAHYLTVAMRVTSLTTSDSWKNCAYSLYEIDLMDIADQYNSELDMKETKAMDEYVNSFDPMNMFCERTFGKIFRTDQDMLDAGHKQSDF